MLFSIAVIILTGWIGAEIFQKLRLPTLVGMLVAGILIGPSICNIVTDDLLSISSQIRQIALIIILTRAGLSLRIDDLRKVGRPALLLSFVPATLEIIGYLILGPLLLSISPTEALLMGSVLAAVSPAVVVPKMLDLMQRGYGTKQGIPQMILAGSSLDDIYVIVLFSTFSALVGGHAVSVLSFLNIPISILAGIVLGIVSALSLLFFFQRKKMDTTLQTAIVLSLSFLLVTAENSLTTPIRFSALIGIMVIGMVIYRKNAATANHLSAKYQQLWTIGQIFLFVLVGVAVDLPYALKYGFLPIILIIGCLIFRSIGVWISLLGTPYTLKERSFVIGAYLPKATVQAAIGAIPLAMHFECGPIILTVAVLGILITAPIGAIFIEKSHPLFLQKENRPKAHWTRD